MEAASLSVNGAPSEILPFAMRLELNVIDPEVIRELEAYAQGKPRDEYSLGALRIGVLALKQARGQVDGETIKREGENLMLALGGKLTLHAEGLDKQITGVLKQYFDPESGRLQERIQRLVKKDGELEDILRRQIGQKDSELCKTLSEHFGMNSPLMKLLSPKESEGLLKSLSDTLIAAMSDQRARVLDEFSLDRPESSLTRLVKKLTDSNGEVNQNLQNRINEVVKEFSLDEKDSALSRLVRRVTKAQRTISKEFSLDTEASALSRMSQQLKSTRDAVNDHLTLDKENSSLFRLKRELSELLVKHAESAQKFQEEVKQAIESMKIRREEAQRSPLGGKDFERITFEWINADCQRTGDIAEFTGDKVGDIKNCKVGDIVVEIGPDQEAGGARIAIEAKDKENFHMRKAREEIEVARKNRGADVGLFVFAKDKVLPEIATFRRIGDDLFVIWDAADPQSDMYLQAGMMVARALCTRKARQRQGCVADFAGIDSAILDIERKAASLDEVRTSAETIKDSADKILKRVELARKGIDNQIAALRDLVADLKAAVQDTATTGN